MLHKIALEEHFIPVGYERYGPGFQAGGHTPERLERTKKRIFDTDELRIAAMDEAGIDTTVLSFTAPGVQGECDPPRAVELAREVNDLLATIVSRHPTRFAGFASVALQDPSAAADELERCVSELGFVGAMVNGFTNGADEETALYYDDPRFEPFWQRVEDLAVPIYLHPRVGVPSQQRIYDGHPELLGASWAFGVETATHSLRLITSGLFDRHPSLDIILGHLGETLPFAIWRFEYWLENRSCGVVLEHPASYYLTHNFYVTTSGFFHTPTLGFTIEQMGAERVLFSVDYPYNDTLEASSWFDAAGLDEGTEMMVGRTNAQRLLKL